MVNFHSPPARKSNASNVLRKSLGPHQRARRSGSWKARKIFSGGAAITRSVMMSRGSAAVVVLMISLHADLVETLGGLRLDQAVEVLQLVELAHFDLGRRAL